MGDDEDDTVVVIDGVYAIADEKYKNIILHPENINIENGKDGKIEQRVQQQQQHSVMPPTLTATVAKYTKWHRHAKANQNRLWMYRTDRVDESNRSAILCEFYVRGMIHITHHSLCSRLGCCCCCRCHCHCYSMVLRSFSITKEQIQSSRWDETRQNNEKKKTECNFVALREHHPSSSIYPKIAVITSFVNFGCVYLFLSDSHSVSSFNDNISYATFGASVGVHLIYAFSLSVAFIFVFWHAIPWSIARQRYFECHPKYSTASACSNTDRLMEAAVNITKIHAQIMMFHCPTSFEHKNPQIHAQIGNRGSHCYALPIQVIPTKKR